MADESGSTVGVAYQGVHKQSSGYKLMAAMGWKEGEGLGAEKQGIKQHVRVRKKTDAVGVGAHEADKRARDWTLHMAAFDRVASVLTEVTSVHARSSGQPSSSSESEAEGADAAKSGGPMKKRKAAAAGRLPLPKKSKKGTDSKAVQPQQAKGKARKAQASPPAPSIAGEDPSSSSGSDSGSEEEAEAPKQAPAPRRVSHVGRFKRREASKAVRGYSSTDLAAILGATDTAAGGQDDSRPRTPPSEEPPAVLSSDDTTSAELTDAANAAMGSTGLPTLGRPAASQAAAANSNTGTERVDGPDGESGKAPWWQSAFVRASRGGVGARPATAAADKGKQARGFTEDDQTALYELTQQGAISGKIGLGKAGALKKVAGARWQGTKTRLGSDSDEGSADEAERADDSANDAGMQEELTQRGVVIVAPLNGGVPGDKVAPDSVLGAGEQGEPAGSKRKTKKKKNSTSQSPSVPAAASEGAASGKSKKSRRGSVGDEVVPAVSSAPAGALQEKSSAGKAEDVESQPAEETAAGASGREAGLAAPFSKPIKWRKLAARALADAAGGQLPVKALTKQVLAAVPGGGDKAGRKRLRQEMLGVLQASSQFVFAADGLSVRCKREATVEV